MSKTKAAATAKKTRVAKGPKKLAKKVSQLATRARKAVQQESTPSTSARAAKAVSKGARPAASQSRRGRSAPQSGPVKEGSRAPSFSLLDQTGQVFASQMLEGQPYVLYFYPKDDTPGCTKEACGFRDVLSDFASRNVRVIGVSGDSPGSHARFEDKYDLNFPLLSDPDRTLAGAYGAWVKKKNYGREYMGIERSTFLVDADGVVRKAWRGVSVPGHVDEVLQTAEELLA